MKLKILASCLTIASYTQAYAASIEAVWFGNSVEAGVITIQGTITKTTADEFERMADANEFADTSRVALSSPGGDLLGGMRLGTLIRKYGLKTEVGRPVKDNPDGIFYDRLAPTTCDSACALAFIGGSPRDAETVEHVGFHQFYDPSPIYNGSQRYAADIRDESISNTQALSGLVVAYIAGMGVDARLFSYASFTGPDDMHYFSRDEAIELGIASPASFTRLDLEPFNGGVIAESNRSESAQGFNFVDQTSFGCDSTGKRYAQLRAPNAIIDSTFPKSAGRVIHQNLETGENVWVSFEGDSVEVIDVPPIDGVLIKLTLDDDMVNAMVAAEGFSVSYNTSRAAGNYYSVHTLNDQERSYLETAFKHCAE